MNEKAKLLAIKHIADLKKNELYLPLSIFKGSPSFLGSITKYLKDELGIKNAEIARILGKDYKSTWQAYRRVKNER